VGDSPQPGAILRALLLQILFCVAVLGTVWWLGAGRPVLIFLGALYAVPIALKLWALTHAARVGPTRSIGTLSVALDPPGAPLRWASDLPREAYAIGLVALADHVLSLQPRRSGVPAPLADLFDPRAALLEGVRAAVRAHREASGPPADAQLAPSAEAPARTSRPGWLGIELIEDRRGLRYATVLDLPRGPVHEVKRWNDRVIALVQHALAHAGGDELAGAADTWSSAYHAPGAATPAGFRATAAAWHGTTSPPS